MASMAAAIAAARTASLAGNRPLDERERKRFTYFSSLNSMARKIMQDKERIRQRYGPDWERMAPREQDEAIDRCLIDPQVQTRYALHREPREPPGPRTIVTGQKVVHFGDEDITWQDEHSAPFSWETRSQMEFSVASVPAQEPSGVPWQVEQKQPVKNIASTQAPKGSHGAQPSKPTQVNKTPSTDGPGPTRKEEESPFWKISAERSRVEGEQAEFQSLTPSQIKSLEKGEKALLSYCRQESVPKERETPKAEKSSTYKQEKPSSLSTASEAAEWEKPQPSHSSIRTQNEVFRAEAGPQKLASAKMLNDDNTVLKLKEDDFLSDQKTFTQVNTSSVVLKTGFDFLDNW
ncbi:uncharacterized protein C1orf198 homolog [Microcaecilia unicolor]|uniref:Uncharacterized protein C1orf198 homolog n=1 Tax=Microcaecilia unicolor TaxID=1415580 RepID=A0A6P7XPL6_9AMPH|nr:uncharacterized protein C1orf198 homolog [Microcaecilia unicolor]